MAELFELEKFDAYREDNRREIKKAKDALPKSLWETYSAFANCRGGVILLGVTEHDDGSWEATGIEDTAPLLKDFWNTVNNPSKVSLNILSDSNVEEYSIEGKKVIAILVPEADRADKPVYLNNNLFYGTYRRNGEGDYRCTKAEVQAMLRDAPENTVDMKTLDSLELSAVSGESFTAYRNRHRSWKAGHVFEAYPDEEYLRAIGAAAVSEKDGRLHPTAAGLLMFGHEYDIVREFPEYFLDYREVLDPTIRWTDRLQSSSGDWSGNVFDFFFRVYGKIIRDIKVPFKLNGVFRVDDTPVHQALREALVNCLVNADFYQPQGVVILKSNNELVFQNPGDIRTGRKQMLRGGISDPRNKNLMKMFNLLGIGERAGSGVPDIFSVWKQQGWEQPVIEENYGPDRTILTLKMDLSAAISENEANFDANQEKDEANPDANQGINDANLDANPRRNETRAGANENRPGNNDVENKILSAINENPYISQSAIADTIGVSRSTVQREMKRMADSGRIKRIGKTRGYWKIMN